MSEPKIGDVFRTSKEYAADDSLEAKPRWFIYLGRVSVLEKPLSIYICTTTTQLKRYEHSSKDLLVYFRESDSIFERDCVLYLKDIVSRFTQEKFQEEYRPVHKGNIGADKLREIIKKISVIDIPKKIKKDIIESFRRAGFPTN